LRKGTLPADDGIIYLALEAVKKLGPPAMEMVHCENYYIINKLQERLMNEGRKDFAAWTDSRPSFTEEEAMRRAMFIAETLDAPLYIPHMSIKEGVGLVVHQKARGFNVVAEVCPHHLTMTKHEKKGWLAKVTNPLRENEDIEALWKGIKDGVVECVGSDHVPYSLKYKLETDIWDIHGAGFQGTATVLPVMLSEGVNKGRIPIERIVDVCCSNPAKVFGIFPKKGTIQIGSDADLVIVDLNKEVTVTAPMLHSVSDLTLYEGWKFKGWPVMTISRGKIIMENGEILGKPGHGKYLHRRLQNQ
jgi:dihydropyrimidinase